MVTVRVLRLVQVAGVDYPPDTLLFVTEQHAERLVKLGLVAIVTTTPAPTYSTRIVTATRTMPLCVVL